MPDTTLAERLRAVLDYDGIPECGRVKRLMKTCGLSRYMAKLVLSGGEPRNMRHFERTAMGLDVDLVWLTFGKFGCFQPRTLRIHTQEVLRYPKDETDKIMSLFVAYKAGHPRATNLMDMASAGKLTVQSAVQLMNA